MNTFPVPVLLASQPDHGTMWLRNARTVKLSLQFHGAKLLDVTDGLEHLANLDRQCQKPLSQLWKRVMLTSRV